VLEIFSDSYPNGGKTMKMKSHFDWRVAQRHCLFVARLLSTILLVLTYLLTAPSLQAQGTIVRTETFALKPNGNVRIDNPRGAIRVQVWDEAAVRVIAEKKAPPGKPFDSSELVLMAINDTVQVGCRQTAQANRIDVIVYLPRRSHVQITGGVWPIEVVGSLASVVVETTSGNISYRIAPTEDVQVVMHSARGVVRSAVPLTLIERAGLHSLQGRTGSGGAPIILNTQSGNITLLPAPATQVHAATAIDQQDKQTSTVRSSGLPELHTATAIDQQNKQETSAPAAPDDPYSIASPPHRRLGTSGSSTVTFSQIDSDKEAEETLRAGPFSRTRQESQTNNGSVGLTVRIIPSGTTAGGTSDPRYRRDSIYDKSNEDEQPSAGQSNRGYSADVVARPPDSSADAASRRTSNGVRSDEGVIKLESALVNLNVSATDRQGRSLTGLKKEDFEVWENGEPQTIEFFAPSTAPFNLVLLLDLSGSIYDKIEVVKSAALHFLDVIGPQDKVAVVTFTREVKVLSQLTTNRDLLRKRIRAIERPEGGTAFYEALWFTLIDTLRGTQGERNAIVVMTDGVDNSLERFNPAPTRVSFDRLLKLLGMSDVIVFPVYLDTEYEEVFVRGNSTSEAYAIARARLQKIAEMTGGQVFQAREASDLAGVYSQVAAALRTVYSVGYYPTNSERDGTFRRVDVRINRPDAVARARKGYYAK
jgi:VWFA-related protein